MPWGYRGEATWSWAKDPIHSFVQVVALKSVVPEPAASPGRLLEMQISRTHSRSESQTLEVGPSNVF